MNRGSKLLELIRAGLAQHSTRMTAQSLGNRSKYIGMSDIGAYLTCPRMAILNRLHPGNREESLSRLLTLNRGHWFEDGIAYILKDQKQSNSASLKSVSNIALLSLKLTSISYWSP